MSDHEVDMPVISMYTRAEALADGELVAAAPELVRQSGLRWPVAYTRSAFADCVAWADEDTDRQGAIQDQTGREWDVLLLLSRAIRRAGSVSHVSFTLTRVGRDGGSVEPEEVELHAVCGPGDHGEPVITVLSSLAEL